MKVSEIFLAVADKLAPEGAWTRKSARDKSGEPVLSTDPRACCWCIFGAICSVATSPLEVDEAYTFWTANNRESMVHFNDFVADNQDEIVAIARKMAYNARLAGI